jgi:HD-like signal output (HDOD) protein
MYMTIPKQLIKKIEALNNLPTLPSIVSSLMAKIRDPLSSASDMAEIILHDLSLSAKLLRLANSTFYGIPRSIANVQDAVVLLGYQVIYTLVLSLSVFDLFPDNRRSPLFDRKAFWKHCVLTGAIAQEIAKKSKIPGLDLNDAFCAGLLHDIGKIVMEQYLHDDMVKTLIYSRNMEIPSFEAEQRVLGFTHYHVSELLIQNWNLPDQLFYPIIFHNQPDTMDILETKISKQSFVNTWICHTADFLSYDEQINPKKKNELRIRPTFNIKALEILGIKKKWEELVEEMNGIGEEVRAIEF